MKKVRYLDKFIPVQITCVAKTALCIALGCSLTAYSQSDALQNAESQVLEKVIEVPETIVISVCRPSALSKMFSNLDFYLNGKIVGEVKNKTLTSYKLRIGDKFKIGQESSILMARYYDDFAIIGTVTDPADVYMIVRINSGSNSVDALIQTLGGAIVLGVTKSFEKGNSKVWSVEITDKEKFSAVCPF